MTLVARLRLIEQLNTDYIWERQDGTKKDAKNLDGVFHISRLQKVSFVGRHARMWVCFDSLELHGNLSSLACQFWSPQFVFSMMW
jgi:hypothetical protein